MELMQLEMFVAVVEEGSVRRAAERVYRTQPAVSIAVRKLEQEFAAPLFDRSKRYRFRMTRAGEALYAYAKRMLGLRTEAASQLKSIAGLDVGRLAIGANESISLHLMPALAHAFLERYPGARLDLRCDGSERLLAELKAGQLDVALLSFHPSDDDLDCFFLAEDELVLVASPKNPLTVKTNVRFDDLKDQPVLLMGVSQASPWHQRIPEAYLRHQIALPLKVENAPIETIKRMVAMGSGLAFVPLLSIEHELASGELAKVPLDEFREVRSVWVARRWSLQSELANAFIQLALDSGKKKQQPQQQKESSKPGNVIAVNRRS